MITDQMMIIDNHLIIIIIIKPICLAVFTSLSVLATKTQL